ncbi:MAG: hypothetical protein ACKKL4_01965 [Patescibacteria group bacterium]
MQILKQTKDWIAVNKALGRTPLECIKDLKKKLPELADKKMAYAGRLDPMASGVLLILIDDACKERGKYLELDKEYILEVLMGVQSDTQDILGVVSSGNLQKLEEYSQKTLDQALQTIIKGFEGKHELEYPIFSSKTVEGKPLFLWALEGRLDEITIPKKAVEIYDIAIEGYQTYNMGDIVEEVKKRIAQVSHVQEASKALGADFRRNEVLDSWKQLQEDIGIDRKLISVTVRARVSSGTYMRTLARLIGEKLGTQALAWRIHRQSIEPYITLADK